MCPKCVCNKGPDRAGRRRCEMECVKEGPGRGKVSAASIRAGGMEYEKGNAACARRTECV